MYTEHPLCLLPISRPAPRQSPCSPELCLWWFPGWQACLPVAGTAHLTPPQPWPLASPSGLSSDPTSRKPLLSILSTLYFLLLHACPSTNFLLTLYWSVTHIQKCAQILCPATKVPGPWEGQCLPNESLLPNEHTCITSFQSKKQNIREPTEAFQGLFCSLSSTLLPPHSAPKPSPLLLPFRLVPPVFTLHTNGLALYMLSVHHSILIKVCD